MKKFLILSAIVLTFIGCKKDDPVNFPKPPKADGGTDQTISLPSNSFSLTGSATTSNGYIKGYLWSLISGPNVPSINSPSSKVTTVSNYIAGTYLFQFSVTDNAGLSDADTVKVIVTQAPIQTLTLQPTNNEDERHLFGGSSIDQSNYAPELDAGAWTSSGQPVYIRGLVKFDLSSIPSNASILTAKLTLYSNPTPLNGNLVDANSGTDNSMYIRRVSSSWVSATTFWSNQPTSTTTDQISIPHTNQKTLDLVDVDVKNLVISMKEQGNYGFMIRLQNEVSPNTRIFCSSRYSNASKHPKLVITYQ